MHIFVCRFVILKFNIENKELSRLYETGKSRLLALPKKVIDKFFLRLECILAACELNDIENDEAMDFRRNRGKNKISLRLIEGWRIEADLVFDNAPNKIDYIKIKEITQTKK